MIKAVVGVCALGCVNFAVAEKLPIKPGMWEVTTTTTNPMTGPRTYTKTECMTEFDYDPEEMMKGLPADACTANSAVLGNTLEYDMACNMGGGEFSGNGSFTVDGDTVNGEMKMNGSFSGQTMEMSMVSEGKRVGDC